MFASLYARSRALRIGIKPVLALSLAVLLAACSSTKQPGGPQVFAWLAPAPPPAPVISPDAELEDDGLPSQAPPPVAIRQLPDDPTAPWSRNYGRSGAGAADMTPAPVARDGWAPVAVPNVPVEESEGLPQPQSAEEAGLAPPPRARRSAALGSGWTTCLPGQSWKCGR